MKEYWEITQERGVQTLAVWYLQPTFEITGATMAEHTTRVDALLTLAEARGVAELGESNARETREDLFAKMANLNVRLPGAVEGDITDDDNLHGQLDKIYAVPGNVSDAQTLRRAWLVKKLWTEYNAQIAAETPPRTALTLKYKAPGSIEAPEVVTVAAFGTLLTAAIAAQETEEAAGVTVTNAKSALRSAERRVDRDNKRWYKAWTKVYPEGTEEGDAARSGITTEQGTPPPNALPIQSVTPNPDRTVLVTYATTGGEHATTLELLWRLQSEADFGHTTPVTRPSQTVGPFPAGTTVTFITRVTNSTTGNVPSTPIAAAISA